MRISAKVSNESGRHTSAVRTHDTTQSVAIPGKTDGAGAGVNGGELLFLALATCFCNDIYREAKERGMVVESVEVEVSGQFGGKGEPAENISYRARVRADGSEAEVLDLMRHTDAIAEIHNTVRQGRAVVLTEMEAVPAGATSRGAAS